MWRELTCLELLLHFNLACQKRLETCLGWVGAGDGGVLETTRGIPARSL